MPSAADLDRLAAKLFEAFERHDLDAVESMLAPDATITQNGNTMTWPEARPLLAGITEVLRNHRYVAVRRIVGDAAVVEEHGVIATTPSGREVRLAACVVIRVDADGAITSLDEYVDVPADLF